MVSIITPTFNSSKFIKDTYTSILSQTVTDWEWLVTDDCSTDDTWSILRGFAESDERVKIVRNEKNSGAAVTRNRSLSRINGEYIAFIDADDIWKPEKLQVQLSFMDNRIDFSFTAYEIISENGNTLDKFVDLHHLGEFTYEDMLRKKATMGCSTVILRRSAFEGLQMPLIRTGQDYAFWLKLLRTGKKAHLLNKPYTKYRIVNNSISRNKVKKAKRQWQVYREIENLNLFKSAECFFFYAFRAVFR